MTTKSGKANSNSSQRSWLSGALVLAAALAAAAAVVAPLSYLLGAAAGLTAAALAWGVCLVAGMSALLIGNVFHRGTQVLLRVMFGMSLRMGVPLAVCMVVHSAGGMLADSGFVFYLMAFYLVTLLVELVSAASFSISENHQAKAA